MMFNHLVAIVLVLPPTARTGQCGKQTFLLARRTLMIGIFTVSRRLDRPRSSGAAEEIAKSNQLERWSKTRESGADQADVDFD